jgi:hypothetical protein
MNVSTCFFVLFCFEVNELSTLTTVSSSSRTFVNVSLSLLVEYKCRLRNDSFLSLFWQVEFQFGVSSFWYYVHLFGQMPLFLFFQHTQMHINSIIHNKIACRIRARAFSSWGGCDVHCTKAPRADMITYIIKYNYLEVYHHFASNTHIMTIGTFEVIKSIAKFIELKT